jgi:hypothetical protein
MLGFELKLDFSSNSQLRIKNSKFIFCITPEEYASHSTPMEYNVKGIPLGRQGRRRDWIK